MNLKLELQGLVSDSELSVFTRIDKLETVINYKMSELSSENQKAILAILTKHVEEMSTTELLEKLANRSGY